MPTGIELSSVLYSGFFIAILCGVYGWFIGILWSPFLIAGRVRALLNALPPATWPANYPLLIPLPATVWGFLWGLVNPLSLELRPPSPASPLGTAGIDGTIVATAFSILIWPTLLLYVLPAKDIDWYSNEHTSTTVALIAAGTVWYFLWLAVPAYYLSIFIGFAQAMDHSHQSSLTIPLIYDTIKLSF